MATKLEHIDLTTIPDTHKGDFRNGWYRHPTGLYLSPLAIAKHRMAGHPAGTSTKPCGPTADADACHATTPTANGA